MAYLGYTHPETMMEDLCNAIREGVLHAGQAYRCTLPFSLFRTCELMLVLLVCGIYRPYGGVYVLPSSVVPGIAFE